MDKCIADDCERNAEKDRKYCRGHRKRGGQGRLRPYGQSPDEYLAAKAQEFADAPDDAKGLRLALKRLKFAAREYVRKTSRQKVAKTTDHSQ